MGRTPDSLAAQRRRRAHTADAVVEANPAHLRSLPDDLSAIRFDEIPRRRPGGPVAAAWIDRPAWPDPLADATRKVGVPPKSSDVERWDNRTPADYSACDEGRPTKKVAVLVAHGMGQQVPFETLDLVVEAISKAHDAQARLPEDAEEQPREQPTSTPAVVRYVNFGDEWIPRAEMMLTVPVGTGGREKLREVHLYEAYWAPLTEGEIGIRDVFGFLFGAAWRGLSNGGKGFRYVLGRRKDVGLSWSGWILLLLIFATLIVAAVAFIVFWVGTATHGLALVHFIRWRDWAMPNLWLATVQSASALGAIVLAGTALSFVSWLRHSVLRERFDGKKKAGAMALIIVFLAMAAAGGAIVYRGFTHGDPWLSWNGGALALATVILIAIALLLDGLRQVIVQFAGDIAIYVSAHRVSRFSAIRERIQAVGRSLARHVYSAHGADGTLEYDQIIVVGHSLGSVIAYDMLNDSIQRDVAMREQFGRSLDVVVRTALFLTFGSPLDKTAFFFRTQKDRLPTREALATAAQPLLRKLSFRPHNWVNIWSPWDWISGPLDYYDPDGPWQPGQVINRIDYDASLLITGAHPGYWHRPLFAQVLYEGVTA